MAQSKARPRTGKKITDKERIAKAEKRLGEAMSALYASGSPYITEQIAEYDAELRKLQREAESRKQKREAAKAKRA